jgi:hypothetical protein
VGWNIGNEKFVRNHLSFINNLKLRASWGKVGDDQVADRFLYSDQWVYNGNAPMGSPIANSPYTFYRISSLGNPNISWETVDKRNVGVDFDFLNGAITGSVDVFRDVRSNIIILGSQRAIPSYFGVSAPSANLGKASGKGYEFELKLSQTIKGWHLWASANVTHAENHVIDRDDPQLLPDYQKQAGWQLNQTRAYVNSGYLQSWDDIYGSTQRNTNNQNKLAGDYNILDYNGDGVIDNADRIPYGYSSTPQNTYNLNVGFDWKGLSAYVQFYGVNNVTREVTFPTFQTPTNVNVAYVEGTYWTKANGGGDIPLPRYAVTGPFGGEGTRYLYDGSYMRLKNAEVSYTLNGRNLNKLGVKTCRIYVNGNNLRLWTKMPDDREANFGTGSSAGAYPTMKRYNLGLDINL